MTSLIPGACGTRSVKVPKLWSLEHTGVPARPRAPPPDLQEGWVCPGGAQSKLSLEAALSCRSLSPAFPSELGLMGHQKSLQMPGEKGGHVYQNCFRREFRTCWEEFSEIARGWGRGEVRPHEARLGYKRSPGCPRKLSPSCKACFPEGVWKIALKEAPAPSFLNTRYQSYQCPGAWLTRLPCSQVSMQPNRAPCQGILACGLPRPDGPRTPWTAAPPSGARREAGSALPRKPLGSRPSSASPRPGPVPATRSA